MNMAIVPWEDVYLNDEIFNLNNSTLNRDNSVVPFHMMQEYLNLNGCALHTIDKFTDIQGLDMIVFFNFNTKFYKNIEKYKMYDRTIYIAFEPPVVDTNHSKEGFDLLLHYFKYILTWNDDLVDNERIFKFMYPYNFSFSKGYSFQEKKLLVNISSNKESDEADELYSERKRIIQYFDNNPLFELYGNNWESLSFRSYRGKAITKSDVYHKFKFAVCLENMNHAKGYITEKILDCFCAQTVPIYMGPDNIDMYVPKECYINYREFANLDELDSFISSMNENEYKTYLFAAQQFLKSDKVNAFSPNNLSNMLMDLAKKRDFEFISDKKLVQYKLHRKIKNSMKIVRKKLCSY